MVMLFATLLILYLAFVGAMLFLHTGAIVLEKRLIRKNGSSPKWLTNFLDWRN